MLSGEATEASLQACIQAKHELLAQFNATPFRPTGLTMPDQALANAVELLEWCTALLVDSVHERSDVCDAEEADREVLLAASQVLRQAGEMFAGSDRRPDLERLEEARRRSIASLHALTPGSEDFRARSQLSFHTHALAVTTLAVGADAVVAAGGADAEWIAEARTRWFGPPTHGPGDERRLTGISKYAGIASRHASLRSVWFINSLRGALALAVAVAVADLSNVQHAFWVVLGTLSVLRTNAASTGSTALRALAGTAAGFVIGGLFLLAIGTSTTALWIALPIAVFVAAYAPGAAPFVVGQAAFTVTVAVLFNLLVPVGWKVGVLRIEDVAIGCAVSVVVGVLFWPRGVASVVGNDLADAYRAGASYLFSAVGWASCLRSEEPAGAMPAITAGLRLDEALRGFLAEQGAKHLPKQELWRLVGGSLRLRLTAHAVAALPRDDPGDIGAARSLLEERVTALDGFYQRLAVLVDRPRGRAPVPPATPAFSDELESSASSRHAIWLCEHLDHLIEHLAELIEPATRLAEVRRLPWWR